MKSKARYCKESGKECFDRRAQAERVLYQHKKRKHCVEAGSVYLCKHCGKYHITHYSYERCRRMTDKRKHKQYHDLTED